MSRQLTNAEMTFLKAVIKEAPDHFRSVVDELTCSKPSVTEASARIPDSSIGNYFEAEKDWFAGYFDLGHNADKEPIFVVELTKEPLTFSDTVKKIGNLPNGYVADPYDYDAKRGLRTGKTVIAPFDVVKAVFDKKGQFGKMFDDVGWVLSSLSHPDNPFSVRFVDFRNGNFGWGDRDNARARSLVVRRGGLGSRGRAQLL